MKNRMSRVKFQAGKRRKLRLKKKVAVFLFLFFFLLLGYSSIKIYNWYSDNDKVNDVSKSLKKVRTKKNKDNENTSYVNYGDDQDSDYFKYIKYSLLEVDFNDLIKENKDTVGWVSVKGTNINYPVVQTTDNDYYLSHAYDKSNNKAGWVFMDYRNNAKNMDQNTVIYAHSRFNGTMFGSLKKLLTSSWYKNKDNYVIWFSTPYENTLWQVFSVYTIPKESYYITTRFDDDDSYTTFLKTIKGRSMEEFSGNVSNRDKILTLSTCKDNFGNRVVMHAKLIKVEKRG